MFEKIAKVWNITCDICKARSIGFHYANKAQSIQLAKQEGWKIEKLQLSGETQCTCPQCQGKML